VDALNTRNETFNLVTPEVTSILELATVLQRQYGVPIRYEPSQEPGLTRCFVSPDKAMRVLKWRYLGLDKGLLRTAQELGGREGHVARKRA
jgi:nucleoside-diphosphate-sugar epimerase